MASLLNMSGSRLIESKFLPYDAEIEYLGFARNCTIDTGIYPSTNYKYYWKYLWLSFSSYMYPFSNKNTRPNWFFFGGVENDPKVEIHIGNSYRIGTLLSVNTLYNGQFMRDGEVLSFLMNNINLRMPYIDYISPSKLVIDNTKGSVINIYNFSICNEDDSYIRDFIPVRVGQVGYMYDRVSKQLFGNSGTGSFILGPDKTN